MKDEGCFDRDLHRFLNMAFEIWPTFKLGLKHIELAGKPCEGAFLPDRSYSTMSP